MDQILKEYLVHTTGLLVCQSGNTFDTATAHQAANSGLGNTLDVVAKHPVVALCTSFFRVNSLLCHLCTYQT